MKLITQNLPEAHIELLDELVKKQFYPNRATAIRVAVRDLLILHTKMKVIRMNPNV